ncbi:MAG: RHS repeat protein [Paludibacteraceae bacterium]|nr:RHS repeat protein [Paludibacteraceae bacterium]
MICKNIYALVIGCACLSATATAATAWKTLGLNGNVMTYSRLKKGANGLELTHKYTFDKNGLLVNVEDKTKGENISYKYNAEGEEVLRIITDAEGLLKDSAVTTYNYNKKKKHITTKFYDETKKLVKADDKWFDQDKRMIKHREIVIGQEGILHGYHYADDGEKEIITRFYDDEPDGSLEKTYDAKHNFVLEVNLDEKRRPISRTTRTFNKKGIKTGEMVEMFCLAVFNGKTTRQYDKKGLLVKEEIFDKNNQLKIGRSLVYDKKGHLLEENYTDGRKTTYAYDKEGHLTEKTDNSADGKAHIQQFSYDSLGNMTRHTNGNEETEFQYVYFITEKSK